MRYYTNYLEHHGIKGQKWGIRRYQNTDGTLTAEGRKRLGYGERKSRTDQNRRRKATKNAKTAEQERAELREYIRDHPKKITKYRKSLTQDDVDAIMKNIEFDRKLKDIRQDEINRGFNSIKNTGTKIATVAGLINQGLNFYNNTAYAYNLLYDLQVRSGADMTGKNKLPISAGGKGKS